MSVHSNTLTTTLILNFYVVQWSLPSLWVLFVSYQVTCCQNMLTEISLSLSRFSNLRMLNMSCKAESALSGQFLISCNSLKVALLRGVIHYSTYYIPEEAKASVLCMLSYTQYSTVPRAWWLGTAASSQYSGDPAMLAACQWLKEHQLGPHNRLVPPSRRNTLTFPCFPGLTTVTVSFVS